MKDINEWLKHLDLVGKDPTLTLAFGLSVIAILLAFLAVVRVNRVRHEDGLYAMKRMVDDLSVRVHDYVGRWSTLQSELSDENKRLQARIERVEAVLRVFAERGADIPREVSALLDEREPEKKSSRP